MFLKGDNKQSNKYIGQKYIVYPVFVIGDFGNEDIKIYQKLNKENSISFNSTSIFSIAFNKLISGLCFTTFNKHSFKLLNFFIFRMYLKRGFNNVGQIYVNLKKGNIVSFDSFIFSNFYSFSAFRFVHFPFRIVVNKVRQRFFIFIHFKTFKKELYKEINIKKLETLKSFGGANGLGSKDFISNRNNQNGNCKLDKKLSKFIKETIVLIKFLNLGGN